MNKYRAIRLVVQLNPRLWFRLVGHRDLGDGDQILGTIGPFSIVTSVGPTTTTVVECAVSFQYTNIEEDFVFE